MNPKGKQKKISAELTTRRGIFWLFRVASSLWIVRGKATYRQHPIVNVCGYKMMSDSDIGPRGRMCQKSHAPFNRACRTHRGRKLGPLSPLALEAS